VFQQQAHTSMLALSLLSQSWPFAAVISKLFERFTGQNEDERRTKDQGMAPEARRDINPDPATSKTMADGASYATYGTCQEFQHFDLDALADNSSHFGYLDPSFWNQFADVYPPQQLFR